MTTRAIGTLGTIDQITMGGRTVTDLSSNLIALIGYLDTNANWTTLRRLGTTAGYQVTAAKTLTVVASRLINYTGTAGTALFAYADNDVGVNVVTVPTNPVYPGSNANSGPLSAGLANTVTDLAPLFVVPATKYLQIKANSGANLMVQLLAYEV